MKAFIEKNKKDIKKIFILTIFFVLSLIGLVSARPCVPSGVFVSSMIYLHKDIASTVFWVGEEPTKENGYISNTASAWDEDWLTNFGGVDDPTNRNGFFPKDFWPNENPFYVALPFNDGSVNFFV